MKQVYITHELRAGFWSAERDGIKRFGRSEVAAIKACKRAWAKALKHAAIQELQGLLEESAR